MNVTSDNDVAILAFRIAEHIPLDAYIAILGNGGMYFSLNLDRGIFGGHFLHIANDGQLHLERFLVFFNGFPIT